jgi:hypothetical protein
VRLIGRTGHQIAAAQHVVGAEPPAQCAQALRGIASGEGRREIAVRGAHELVGQHVDAASGGDLGREHFAQRGTEPRILRILRKVVELDDRDGIAAIGGGNHRRRAVAPQQPGGTERHDDRRRKDGDPEQRSAPRRDMRVRDISRVRLPPIRVAATGPRGIGMC